jgi:hypothetical protein
LITFKLLEESGGWTGDDWDDSDDFLHDLVLDKDVSLGFDDLDVHIVILWLIYDWVLAFGVNFRQRHHASDPRVFRVSQRFYTFNVRIELSFILGVEVWKVFRLIQIREGRISLFDLWWFVFFWFWFWFYFLLSFNWGNRIIQVRKRLVFYCLEHSFINFDWFSLTFFRCFTFQFNSLI